MKNLHYDLPVNDEDRYDTLEIANIQTITGLIPNPDDTWFFNVNLGSGVGVSSNSKSKEVLEQRRTDLKEARTKFMKKFYKKMAKLNNKIIVNKKEVKQRNKNIKKELSLLKQIVSNTTKDNY